MRNEHGINLTELVERHANGDDGDLCKADQALNDLAIKTEGRIFSSYTIDKTKLYVITEWDRSYTTVILQRKTTELIKCHKSKAIRED